METTEIERIEREALASEAAQAGPEMLPGGTSGENGTSAPGGSVVEEFAAFLDFGAGAIGHALPFIPQRFTPDANLKIAGEAEKLCIYYGYDPRATLLGGDSVLSRWLGLALAIGVPGFMCYQDYKFLKAKEVREAAGDGSDKQPGE